MSPVSPSDPSVRSDLHVTWSLADDPFDFRHEPDGTAAVLTLPDGRTVVLSTDAWLGLRPVLDLLAPVSAPPQSPAIISANFPAAEALRVVPRHPAPANRGRPWTDAEHASLADAFAEGTAPVDIARSMGRTRGAVLARLVRLGLLDEAEAGLRYPASRSPTAPSAPA